MKKETCNERSPLVSEPQGEIQMAQLKFTEFQKVECDIECQRTFPQKEKSQDKANTITLELMPNRQIKWMLILTWTGFLASLILQLLKRSAFVEPKVVTLYDFHSSQSVDGVQSSFMWSMNESTCNGVFAAQIDDTILGNLYGVVSLELSVNKSLAYQYQQISSNPSINFYTEILACVEPKGCHDQTVFQLVLQQDLPVLRADVESGTITVFKIFQNQESFLGTGTITAYSIKVHFYGFSISGESLFKLADNFQLNFQVETETSMKSMQYGGLVAFFWCIGFGAWWFWVVYKHDSRVFQWFPERKWLLLFWIGVVLMSNPVFVFSYFGDLNPGNGFAAALLQNLGASIVAYVILLFSDVASPALSGGQDECLGFYLIKAIPCAMRFIPMLLMKSIEYSSIFGLKPSPVLAMQNWNEGLRYYYYTCAAVFFVSLILWVVMLIYFLFCTKRVLVKKNYMDSRRHQLGYSFFYFQFSLYAILIFFKVNSMWKYVVTYSGFADFICSVASPQPIYIRLIFLVILLTLEMHMYLPCKSEALSDSGDLLQKRLLEFSENEDSLSTTLQDNSFVIETGLKMAQLADEVYYEPEYVHSKTGFYDCQFNPQRVGCKFLKWIYKADEEVNCMVVSDPKTKSLIVVFRGSVNLTN